MAYINILQIEFEYGSYSCIESVLISGHLARSGVKKYGINYAITIRPCRINNSVGEIVSCMHNINNKVK